MKKNLIAGLFFAASTMMLGAANASIVSVTGDGVDAGAVSTDMSQGVLESNLIQAFAEDVDVNLTDTIFVDYDITDAGVGLVGFNNSVGQGGGSGSLDAGLYDSFLLHFDPLSGGSALNATFEFSSNIVALVVSIDGLQGTDAIFNSVTTDYNSGDNVNGRRTEAGDQFSFNGSFLDVSILTTTSQHIDHIRVITVADSISTNQVSAPSIASVFALGLALIGMRRFRQVKN